MATTQLARRARRLLDRRGDGNRVGMGGCVVSYPRSIDEMTDAEIGVELMRRMGTPKHLDFQQLQDEVREWSTRNFGDLSPMNSIKNVLGVVEEAGELVEEEPSASVLMIALGRLSHSHLKELQGIRGSADEHQAKIKDAIGDIIIYLADYSGSRGFNLQEIIEMVWSRVKLRDWTVNKLHGGDVASHRELHPEEADYKEKFLPLALATADELDRVLSEQTHGVVRWTLDEDFTQRIDPILDTDPSYKVLRPGLEKLARHGLAISDTGTIIDMNRLEEQHAKDAEREALGGGTSDSDIPF